MKEQQDSVRRSEPAPDRFEQMAWIAGTASGLRQEQFAGLAHIFRKIAEDEREACAKIAETTIFDATDTEWDEGVNFAKRILASRIRAL